VTQPEQPQGENGAAYLRVVLLAAAIGIPAIGYVIFLGLGTWGGIHQSVLTVPGLPKYHSASVPDLLIGIGVGIAAALVIAGVRFAGNRVDGLPVRPRRRPGQEPAAGHGHARLAVLLLGGALAVGLLALLARALGANSQDVLFSGQASVPALVAQQSLKIVLILLVAKGLAYAVSLSCGFRGGPVFPAIFLGARWPPSPRSSSTPRRPSPSRSVRPVAWRR
jgi:chloride channel protein, CIC family